jgi:hypothetical protein
MKKNTIIYALAISCLVLSSCDKDPVPNPDGTFPECTVLTGNQNDDIILTNHVADPAVPDYCIEGTYQVFANLVIEPGVKIQMKNGSKISVIGNGSFKSVGTSGERIKIQGESTSLKGQWEFIYIRTNTPENRIEYTDITGGGSNATYNALVYVDLSGYLNVDESYFGFSAANGLKAGTPNVTLGGVSNSVFSLNDLYPIEIDAQQIGSIASSNTGDANLYDLIQVHDSQLTSPTTINACSSFPYHIIGQFGINSDVTVQPGTRFQFEAGARMIVWTGGSFNCVGTAADRIRFTGDSATPGSWEGIRYISSTSTLNRFDYCDFSYGGSSSTYTGIITLWTTSYLRLGNSSVTNSAGHGLFNPNNASTFVDDGNNSFSGNAMGDFGN